MVRRPLRPGEDDCPALIVQLPPDFAAGVHEWKVDERMMPNKPDPRSRSLGTARARLVHV